MRPYAISLLACCLQLLPAFAYADFDSLQSKSEALQREAVALVEALRIDEAAVKDASTKQETLRADIAHVEASLKTQHQLLSDAVRGIRTVGRWPKAIWLAPSVARDEKYLTAQLLSRYQTHLREKMETLNKQLTEWKRLRLRLSLTEKTLAEKKEALAKAHKELSAQLEKRREANEALWEHRSEPPIEMALLADRAKDIGLLLDEIEKTHIAQADEPGILPHAKPAQKPSPPPVAFLLRLPVQGPLLRHYGEKKENGEKLKGLVVAAMPGSPVVAPRKGEVVFAGPFRDYGKMVILRHGDRYHTLVAGLGQIDVTVGQFLLEGEPMGAMASGGVGEAELYLELRHQSHPVDPAPRLAKASLKLAHTE